MSDKELFERTLAILEGVDQKLKWPREGLLTSI